MGRLLDAALSVGTDRRQDAACHEPRLITGAKSKHPDELNELNEVRSGAASGDLDLTSFNSFNSSGERVFHPGRGAAPGRLLDLALGNAAAVRPRGEPIPYLGRDCEKSEESEKRSGGPAAAPARRKAPAAERPRKPVSTAKSQVVPPGVTAFTCETVYITTPADLDPVIRDLSAADTVALDFETTGFSPRQHQARLLQLAVTETRAYVLDLNHLPPEVVRDRVLSVIATKRLIGHSLIFDLGWLPGLGLPLDQLTGTPVCLLTQDKILTASGAEWKKGCHSLGAVVQRSLRLHLNKEQDHSVWRVTTLTEADLGYAARDAAVLIRLDQYQTKEIIKARLAGIAEIESGALWTTTWMAQNGVGFDRDGWAALVAEKEAEQTALVPVLNEIAGPCPPEIKRGEWLWNYWVDIAVACQRAGLNLPLNENDNPRTGAEVLAQFDHPLTDALLKYKAAAPYGHKWLAEVQEKGSEVEIWDGRLYAHWHPMGCRTGRMSCSNPNLQNIPRDPRYRACFRAPEGRVLITADYSTIELRLAASYAPDPAMLQAFQDGIDIHYLTASLLLNKPLDQVTKQERQLAKAINFGFLFGMREPTFREYALASFGVPITLPEARQHREDWFAAYPGIKAWHAREEASGTRDTRTPDGRRRRQLWHYTQRLNSPIQGAGADGLKRALHLLGKRRDQAPGAIPVAAIHDALLIECAVDQVDQAKDWVRGALEDGMRSVLTACPIGVEIKVGRTWADEG